MSCVTSLKVEHLKRCATTEPGFRTKLNYGRQADFTTTPLAPLITDTITNEDAGTAIGTFVAVATKGFATIDVFMDKPLEEAFKLNGQSLESELDFYVQNNAEGKGFIRKFKNEYMIFAPESINGDFILIGDSKTAAMISEIEGKNGTESYIKFKVKSMPFLGLHWSGTLPMIP
jgi:hypothetical protein